jgi:hypothetical protein
MPVLGAALMAEARLIGSLDTTGGAFDRTSLSQH